jgi:phage tail tape-measure protein
MNAKQILTATAISLALAASGAYANDTNDTNARPMTGKEKATAIGAGTGAVAGAVVGGPVGAVVGGVAGGVIGHEGTDAHGRVNTTDSRTSDSRASSPSMASDSSVTNAQNALNSQGYNAGSADGRMGPTTRSAIMKFQADHNLPQTGTLDSATQNALNTK